jgi:hypothetical protein
MKSFWMMVFNVVFGVVMGNIIAIVNDGTRAEAAILSFIFILWLDIRDIIRNNE